MSSRTVRRKPTPAESVVGRAVGYVRKWQRPLSLESWRVTVRASTCGALKAAVEKDVLAVVYPRLPELRATIEVAVDWDWTGEEDVPDHHLETVIVHELCHIRLASVEEGVWRLVADVEGYLPKGVEEVQVDHWEHVREEMVNTLAAVAMEGERQWSVS